MSVIEAVDKPVYRTYEDFDYNSLNTYAGLDCIATSKVLSKIFPKLVERPTFIESKDGGVEKRIQLEALVDVNEKIGSKILDFVIDLEINGMKYDCDKNREIHGRMVEEIGLLEDNIYSMVGKKLDLNSGTKMAQFLYEELGLIPPYMTATGEPSTDGDALLTLAGLDPTNPGRYVTEDPSKQFLAHIARCKDITSTHRTFIETYIEDFVKRDGRIHASYNLHGTSSFRLSGEAPNFTQLPRNKHGYSVRECYTVDEGNVMLLFDFSSAEMKILACLSGDEAMKEACFKGFDFHTFTASTMRGIPYEEFLYILKDRSHPLNSEYKLARQGAKAVGFGIVYGSSAVGIATGLGISKEEAQALIDLYFNKFPRVKDFIAKQHQHAILNNQIVTPFGQRRQSYGSSEVFKKTAAYNASLRGMQNCSIQSPTSTLGLITFAAMNEAIKRIGGKSVCTVIICGPT